MSHRTCTICGSVVFADDCPTCRARSSGPSLPEGEADVSILSKQHPTRLAFRAWLVLLGFPAILGPVAWDAFREGNTTKALTVGGICAVGVLLSALHLWGRRMEKKSR